MTEVNRAVKSAEQIERYIATLIEEVRLGQVSTAEVRSDQELIGDLGLDSLDYAAVLLGAERWLGVTVQEAGVDWGQIRTVGQLATFLEGQQRT